MSNQPSIRVLRRSLDLSLKQLARMTGIPHGSLSRLELGTGAAHHEQRVRDVLTAAQAKAEKQYRKIGERAFTNERTNNPRQVTIER